MSALVVVEHQADRARAALHACDPGCDRETWVRVSMAAKAAGIGFDFWHDWCAGAGNYRDEADCRAVWRSINDAGGIGAGTLFDLAQKAGPENEPRRNGRQAHKPTSAIQTHAEQTKRAQAPAGAALAVWDRFSPADDMHPYVVAKRGRPDGLRVVPADDPLTIAGQNVSGWLAVPVRSLDGELRTIQFIPAPGGEGKKLNMPGASFGDGLFVVGDLAQTSRAFIVEGLGQAWACRSATGCAAAVCFGAGRMAAVAEILRRRFPALALVLVPDRGKENQAAEIARRIRGEWVELPGDKPANYDANDFAAEHGANDLAALLGKVKAPARAETQLKPGNAPAGDSASQIVVVNLMDFVTRDIRPRERILAPWLLTQSLNMLYAWRGIGKTHVALGIGYAPQRSSELTHRVLTELTQ